MPSLTVSRPFVPRAIGARQVLSHVCLDPRIVLITVTLLGALIRILRAGISLSLDEAALYWIARGSLSSALSANAASNSAPPLFALLTHVVLYVNSSELALRAVPLIAGTVSIPSVYFLALHFMDSRQSTLVAMLTAFTPEQVFYSHDVREYSLTVLLTILTLHVFVHVLAEASLPNTITLSILMATGVLTQYGMTVIVFAITAVWFTRLRRAWLQHYLVYWLILYVPVLAAVAFDYRSTLRTQMQPGGFASASYLAAFYWNHRLSSLAPFLLHGIAQLIQVSVSYWSLPLLPLVLIGICRYPRASTNSSLLLLLSIALISLLCTFALSLLTLYPFGGTRQDIFLVPLIALVLGSLAWLPESPSAVNALLLTVTITAGAASAWYVTRSSAIAGYELINPLVQYWQTHREAGDRLYVYANSELSVRYYLRDTPGTVVHMGARRAYEHPGAYWIDGASTRVTIQVTHVLRMPGRVFFLLSHCDAKACDDIVAAARTQRHVVLRAKSGTAYLWLAGSRK